MFLKCSTKHKVKIIKKTLATCTKVFYMQTVFEHQLQSLPSWTSFCPAGHHSEFPAKGGVGAEGTGWVESLIAHPMIFRCTTEVFTLEEGYCLPAVGSCSSEVICASHNIQGSWPCCCLCCVSLFARRSRVCASSEDCRAVPVTPARNIT